MMNLYVLLSRGEKGKLETMEHLTLSSTFGLGEGK